MANDAKLGLVLGVSIVLIVALVFFRAEARPTTVLHKDVAPATQIESPR